MATFGLSADNHRRLENTLPNTATKIHTFLLNGILPASVLEFLLREHIKKCTPLYALYRSLLPTRSHNHRSKKFIILTMGLHMYKPTRPTGYVVKCPFVG